MRRLPPKPKSSRRAAKAPREQAIVAAPHSVGAQSSATDYTILMREYVGLMSFLPSMLQAALIESLDGLKEKFEVSKKIIKTMYYPRTTSSNKN
jgi:hypothetical protein